MEWHRSGRHCGIENPGTLCWLASCVHALARITRFRQYLYNMELTHTPEHETRDRFIEQLQLTFHKLHTKRSPISVCELQRAGRQLYIEKDMFHSNMQEDCIEHFFQILHTFDYPIPALNPNKPDMFEKAMKCFEITATTDGKGARIAPYQIPLQLISPVTNFYASLRTYMNIVEDAPEDKQIWIKSLPEVLTFGINRSRKGTAKSTRALEVEVRIYLDRHLESRKEEAMNIFCADDPEEIFEEYGENWSREEYTLTAVIMHVGERTDAGHYYAFVLEIERNKDESIKDYKYLLYDDSKPVEKFTIDEVQGNWSGTAWRPGERVRDRYDSASLLIYTKTSVVEKKEDFLIEHFLYSDSLKKAIRDQKNREYRAEQSWGREKRRDDEAQEMIKRTAEARSQLAEPPMNTSQPTTHQAREALRKSVGQSRSMQDVKSTPYNTQKPFAREVQPVDATVERGSISPIPQLEPEIEAHTQRRTVRRTVDDIPDPKVDRSIFLDKYEDELDLSDVEEDSESDNFKKRMDEISEIERDRERDMDAEQELMDDVRSTFDSASLKCKSVAASEWAYSSTALYSQDRHNAIGVYMDHNKSDNNDDMYPDRVNEEMYKKRLNSYRNLVDYLYELESPRVVDVRSQQQLLLWLNLEKDLPSEFIEKCPETDLVTLRGESDDEVQGMIYTVIDWVFKQKREKPSAWWKNALLFCLYLDGDLSPVGAARSVIRSAKIDAAVYNGLFVPLLRQRNSSLPYSDYIFRRYDLFLLIAYEYTTCINMWSVMFPRRESYEEAARKIDTSRMEYLYQCQSWMNSHLLSVFACMYELLKDKDKDQEINFGIDFTVLGRVAACAYALTVLRLLHASRQMVRGGNVGVANRSREEKYEAVKVNKLRVLGDVKQILRALFKLSTLLSWWQSRVGANQDIVLARRKMEGALQRASKNLGVPHDLSNVGNLPKATLEVKWREKAIEAAESLMSESFAVTEKRVFCSMGDFATLIKIIFECEAHTPYASGEKHNEEMAYRMAEPMASY